MISARVDVELERPRTGLCESLVNFADGTAADVGWRFIPRAKMQAGFEAQARAMAAK